MKWTTATIALIAALALASRADAQTEGAPDPIGEPTIVGIVGGWAINQLWLFWVAPIVGGSLGAAVYRFIGSAQE